MPATVKRERKDEKTFSSKQFQYFPNNKFFCNVHFTHVSSHAKSLYPSQWQWWIIHYQYSWSPSVYYYRIILTTSRSNLYLDDMSTSSYTELTLLPPPIQCGCSCNNNNLLLYSYPMPIFFKLNLQSHVTNIISKNTCPLSANQSLPCRKNSKDNNQIALFGILPECVIICFPFRRRRPWVEVISNQSLCNIRPSTTQPPNHFLSRQSGKGEGDAFY